MYICMFVNNQKINNMHKIFNSLALVVLLFSLSACNRGYTVYGEMPIEEFNGAKVYLRNIADGSTIDSTVIENGTFQFKGKAPQSQIVSVFTAAPAGQYASNIVLENGKIHINLVNDTLYGTPMNDLYYNSFTADTTVARMESDLMAFTAKYYAAATPEEQVAVAADYGVAMSAYEAYKLNQARKVYKKNKDNIVGAYALCEIVNSQDSGMDFHKLDSIMSRSGKAISDYEPLRMARKWLFNIANTSEGKKYVDVDGIDFATGQPTKLSAMLSSDQVTLVDFWASWCGPCRKEISENLVRLYQKYSDKGLNIIGIDVWDKIPDHKKAVEDLGITYPQLIDTTRTATDNYGINGIPAILLLDRDGKILKRNLRGDDIEPAIVEALANKE